jgi:hypothetical protein
LGLCRGKRSFGHAAQYIFSALARLRPAVEPRQARPARVPWPANHPSVSRRARWEGLLYPSANRTSSSRLIGCTRLLDQPPKPAATTNRPATRYPRPAPALPASASPRHQGKRLNPPALHPHSNHSPIPLCVLSVVWTCAVCRSPSPPFACFAPFAVRGEQIPCQRRGKKVINIKVCTWHGWKECEKGHKNR